MKNDDPFTYNLDNNIRDTETSKRRGDKSETTRLV